MRRGACALALATLAGCGGPSDAELLEDAREAVARDARARVAAGELKGPIIRVECEDRAQYHRCVAIRKAERRVEFGYPYEVKLRDGRFTIRPIVPQHGA